MGGYREKHVRRKCTYLISQLLMFWCFCTYLINFNIPQMRRIYASLTLLKIAWLKQYIFRSSCKEILDFVYQKFWNQTPQWKNGSNVLLSGISNWTLVNPLPSHRIEHPGCICSCYIFVYWIFPNFCKFLCKIVFGNLLGSEDAL